MSWLSKATGIHISPHGAHLSTPDPIGTIKDIAHNPLPLLGALALPGVGGLLGSIPGASAVGSALSSIPGVSSLDGALGIGGSTAASAIPDEAMGIGGSGGGLSGLLGTAGKFLTANGGKNALGLAQGVNSILDQKKAENYGKDALGAATGAYNAAAPLRAQGISQILNPQTQDLSALKNIAGTLTVPRPASAFQDAGNPYARQG